MPPKLKVKSFSLTDTGNLHINLEGDMSSYNEFDANKEGTQQLVDQLKAAGIKVHEGLLFSTGNISYSTPTYSLNEVLGSVGLQSVRNGDLEYRKERNPGAALFAGEPEHGGALRASLFIDQEADPVATLAMLSKTFNAPGILESYPFTKDKVPEVIATVTADEWKQSKGDLTKLSHAAASPVKQSELGPELNSLEKAALIRKGQEPEKSMGDKTEPAQKSAVPTDPKSFTLAQNGTLVINLGDSALSVTADKEKNLTYTQSLIDDLKKMGIQVSYPSSSIGGAVSSVRGITGGVALFAGDEGGAGTPQATFTVSKNIDPTDPEVLAQIAKALKSPGMLTEGPNNMFNRQAPRVVTATINHDEFAEAGGDLEKLTMAAADPVRSAELAQPFVPSAEDMQIEKARRMADLIKTKTAVKHTTDGADIDKPLATTTLNPELQKLVKHIDALLEVSGMEPKGLKAFSESGHAEMAESATHSVEVLQQIKKSINNPQEFNRLVGELANDEKAIKSIQKAVDASVDDKGEYVDLSGDYVRLKTSLKHFRDEPLPEVPAKAEGRPR